MALTAATSSGAATGSSMIGSIISRSRINRDGREQGPNGESERAQQDYQQQPRAGNRQVEEHSERWQHDGYHGELESRLPAILPK